MAEHVGIVGDREHSLRDIRSPEIDWATEPGVDPVFRAAILWWHQHTGGSGFDDVYTVEEFLAHVRPLIEAAAQAKP